MAEPKRKPPHAGKRLTRDDVLRLIDEHGGPEGLELSERDLRQAELTSLDLHRASLFHANLAGADLWWANLDGAILSAANLQGAHLNFASLQRAEANFADLHDASLDFANLDGADLRWANLQGAMLSNTNVHGADLRAADVRRAWLAHATLRDTRLEGANWGDYVLGDEIAGDFGGAASAYRALKQRHTETGMYDIAGEFHYREMEARRKLARQERRFLHALGLNLSRWLYGYGERPQRVIGWAAAVVFGLALLVHWPFGTVEGGFWDALYYSAVSFTALGYGASDSDPQGWAGRFLGAAESFMGVFMMALFLVTFTRKMTR